ncbi:MAG: DDE-type integrase/transposase/recombinase, partial [Candidatus Thiodiazotropha taylori]|nr:DDE-type integrase/transposase/recombinase [Candidatus Thiodiazotropha taylori]MCW4309545.1 RNase H-like domain-containing protein [Candidatus Thiodiazotropha endolucinida]
EQQQAFETIISSLINPPVLAYADYSLPFELHTDATLIGLGAVLYQEQDGKKRVVAYASRSLKVAEKNYPAHKLEFLALKWAVVEKFHDYLYGSKFEAVTDNNPLTYIFTTAKLDATGQRWVAALSNYNFCIKYRCGRNNTDADGLSRRIEKSDEEVIFPDVLKAICQSVYVASPLIESVAVTDNVSATDDIPEQLRTYALTLKDWRKAQRDDLTLNIIIDQLEAGSSVLAPQNQTNPVVDRRYFRGSDRLFMLNDVLHRKVDLNGQEFQQLVLPMAFREFVFNAFHNDLGHQGRDRTTSLIKQRFYWPAMDSYIADKVAECHRCTLRKTHQDKSAGLVNIVSSAPMELICLDYLSLERSKGGVENILVITDHFSRYAQAVPTRNQTARTTARVLFDHFIVHYGFPARIHSDQGQTFESNLIKELCDLAGVEKSRTTPYHAMGNGQCERFNQTLLKMLGTLEEYQKSDWKAHVPTLVHAYNATFHDSTRYSPFFLMFGRHPRLAIDAFLGLSPDTLSAASQTEYVRKLRQRLDFAYKAAEEAAKQSTAQHKRYYDLKVRNSRALYPGDRVLMTSLSLRGKQKLADRSE